MRMLLGFAGLTTLWFLYGTCAAQPKPAPPPKVALAEVSGVGSSEENAKKNAVRKAVEAINRLMAAQDPPLISFVVTEDYVISNNLFRDPGRAGKEVRDVIQEKEVVSKEWIVTFRNDTDWWTDVVRKDHELQRKVRSEQRQTLGSRLIIGLALVLLAGFGYVRLDEYTQRRYTTWLRVAGVGVATTAVAGWWWVFILGA